MTLVGAGEFGFTAAAGERKNYSMSAIFSNALAGTYQVGLCGDTSSTAWNNNEYSYTTAILFN